MNRPEVILAWCWIALPIIAIATTWFRFFRPKERGGALSVEALVQLLIPTLSYFWLMTGMFFSGALGPDYSSRRFATIQINLGVMIGCSLWALIRGRHLRWLLLACSALTASVWFYAAIVSVAV